MDPNENAARSNLEWDHICELHKNYNISDLNKKGKLENWIVLSIELRGCRPLHKECHTGLGSNEADTTYKEKHKQEKCYCWRNVDREIN